MEKEENIIFDSPEVEEMRTTTNCYCKTKPIDLIMLGRIQESLDSAVQALYSAHKEITSWERSHYLIKPRTRLVRTQFWWR